jgi:hypothetical protein
MYPGQIQAGTAVFNDYGSNPSGGPKFQQPVLNKN